MSPVVLFREQVDVFGRQTEGLIEDWKHERQAVQARHAYEDWINLGLGLLEACEEGLAGWRRRVHRDGAALDEVSAGWKELLRSWCRTARRGVPEGIRLSQHQVVDRFDEFSAEIRRVESMIADWRKPEASVLPGMRNVKLTAETEAALLHAVDEADAAPKRSVLPTDGQDGSEHDYFAGLMD